MTEEDEGCFLFNNRLKFLQLKKKIGTQHKNFPVTNPIYKNKTLTLNI